MRLEVSNVIRFLTGSVLVALSALSQPPVTAQQDSVLSVCEILDNRQKYGGRVVAVRGDSVTFRTTTSNRKEYNTCVATPYSKWLFKDCLMGQRYCLRNGSWP